MRPQSAFMVLFLSLLKKQTCSPTNMRFSTSIPLCRSFSSTERPLHSSLSPNKASGDATPPLSSLLLTPHSSLLSPSSPLWGTTICLGSTSFSAFVTSYLFSYTGWEPCLLLLHIFEFLALCFAHSMYSVITEWMIISILPYDWVTSKNFYYKLYH